LTSDPLCELVLQWLAQSSGINCPEILRMKIDCGNIKFTSVTCTSVKGREGNNSTVSYGLSCRQSASRRNVGIPPAEIVATAVFSRQVWLLAR